MTSKWYVKIRSGYFLAGIHRFETQREAKEFCLEWLSVNGAYLCSYSDIPIVEKDRG